LNAQLFLELCSIISYECFYYLWSIGSFNFLLTATNQADHEDKKSHFKSYRCPSFSFYVRFLLLRRVLLDMQKSQRRGYISLFRISQKYMGITGLCMSPGSIKRASLIFAGPEITSGVFFYKFHPVITLCKNALNCE
jgi:hypothetical protein